MTERTEISKDTLSRVFTAQEKVDRRTLQSCFLAFNLTLEPQDYYHPNRLVISGLPELPNGQVPLDSRFYVERSPIENQCYQGLTQAGNLIRIKAARGMGKTSLMARMLNYGQHLGYTTLSLSLQLADRQIFQATGLFFQWLGAAISVGLQVRNCVRDYWDEFLGHKYSLKAYFLNYLLPCMQSPLVVAIDEVDILFNYPDLAEDFFAFLRTLYEEARNNTTLQKLRFVITHSTDVYLPLDNNQSPFNIGLLAELPLLNSKDVDYLATQYNLNLSSIEINQLLQWVGGNPYLIRLALHNIYYKNATFEQIISPKFTVNNYIYKEHLQQQLAYVVSEKLGLTSAFAQLIKAQNPIEIDLEAAMKLQGLGLINLSGKQAYCSCQLYTEYFREHLG